MKKTEIEILKKALEFYSNKDNYEPVTSSQLPIGPSKIERDGGAKAREALDLQR